MLDDVVYLHTTWNADIVNNRVLLMQFGFAIEGANFGRQLCDITISATYVVV